ncbi:MAG: hypothetical protein ACOCP4_05370 [Candidatus Woesearchaeota archaeon]
MHNKKIKLIKSHFEEIAGWKNEIEFNWVVFSEYKIGNPLQKKIDKTYIYKTENSSKKLYNPFMKCSDLFLKFAHLAKGFDYSSDNNYKIIDNKEVLKWIHEYGLLEAEGIEIEEISNGQEIYPLRRFYKEIIKAKRLVTLLEQVINKENQILVKRIQFKESQSKLDVFLDNIYSGISYEAYPINEKNEISFLKEDYFYIALQVIMDNVTDVLSDKITLSYKKIEFDKNELNPPPYKIYPSNSCKDLLGVMYLQFYRFLTQKKPIGFCEYCGNSYELKPTNKKFCTKYCRENNHYHKTKGD